MPALQMLLIAISLVRPPDPAVTVPMQVLRTRHIAVQTRINDQGPFRLALDTGAPITFINRRVAVKLGLMKEEAAKKPMMIGMGGQVVVKSLEVGGARAESVPVIILDHPIVEMIGQVEGGIDGIVGYTFWSRYRMSIDYQARQLTLEPNGYQPQDVLSGVVGRLMRMDDRPPVVAPAGIWGMRPVARKGGVYVEAVTPGWPAAAAGLRAGDRIRTVNRRWTDTLPDLVEALPYAHAGEPAEVVLERAGKTVTALVRPRSGL